MKVISIMEPYASLIALELKRFETRSWATKYRGTIAIHASKKIDRQAVLMIASKYPEIWHKISPVHPGCIIAIAELVGCYRIYDTLDNGKHIVRCPNDKYDFDKVVYLHQPETDFGWFEEGRFAWELSNVKRIEPIPAKGQLGLWNWEGEVKYA